MTLEGRLDVVRNSAAALSVFVEFGILELRVCAFPTEVWLKRRTA